MRSWQWILCAIGLMMAMIVIERQRVNAEGDIAPATDASTAGSGTAMPESGTASDTMTFKCPKCGHYMEEGFVLDVQGDANNERAAALWIQGPISRSFWTGVTTRKRARRPITAFRCTTCGFLEMYAR
jgi:predicted RNA-binding Zn-ribbon protein involved in translation (DUF1610 family)